MLNKIIKIGGLELWSKSVKALRKNHPLQSLFWECTLKCNFNCLHCGSDAGVKDCPNELTTQEIKSAFQDVADNFDAKKIQLNITGGEPLLREDLFEVIKFARELGFNWGLVSNGFLIDDEAIEKMKETGMNSITISVDGLEKEHDYFRQKPGSYKKALEVVKKIAGKNFMNGLNITTNVYKGNFKDLNEMYEIFKETGIDSWRLVNTEPIGRAERNKELLLNGKEIRDLLTFIKETNKKSDIEVCYECGGFLGTDFEGDVRRTFFMCCTGITVGSILANGDIFVCPNVPRKKELIQGNVRKDSFSKIWNEKYDFFRNPNRTACEECLNCEHWKYCRGNSLHSWDFENNKPKLCHIKLINNKNKK